MIAREIYVSKGLSSFVNIPCFLNDVYTNVPKLIARSLRLWTKIIAVLNIANIIYLYIYAMFKLQLLLSSAFLETTASVFQMHVLRHVSSSYFIYRIYHRISVHPLFCMYRFSCMVRWLIWHSRYQYSNVAVTTLRLKSRINGCSATYSGFSHFWSESTDMEMVSSLWRRHVVAINCGICKKTWHNG